jgi:hypothetical protein
MNYCLSGEKPLLRNRLCVFLLFCLTSFCVTAQDVFKLDSLHTSTQHGIVEGIQSDSIFKNSGNITSKWIDSARSYYSGKNRNIFVLPFVSWNDYDELYQGIALFSNPVNSYRLKYSIFPAWSFFSSSFLFSGQLSYRTGNTERENYLKPLLNVRSYSYDHIMRSRPAFISFHPGAEFVIGRKDSLRRGVEFNLMYHYVMKEQMIWNIDQAAYELTDFNYSIFQLQMKTHLLRFADENTQILNIEMNEVMGKVSLTEEHMFRLMKPGKGLYFRLFAGAFLYSQLPSDIDYRFRLSGYRGRNDYLFDLPYLARSETDFNVLSGQVYPFDGYFKTPTPLGQTWDWLIALNFRADLPGILPLQFYFDAGTYSDAKVIVPSSGGIPWNAGLIIKIKKDIAEIYIPLFMSNDIRDIYELNQVGFFQRITWMVRFDKLSMSEILKHK